MEPWSQEGTLSDGSGSWPKGDGAGAGTGAGAEAELGADAAEAGAGAPPSSAQGLSCAAKGFTSAMLIADYFWAVFAASMCTPAALQPLRPGRIMRCAEPWAMYHDRHLHWWQQRPTRAQVVSGSGHRLRERDKANVCSAVVLRDTTAAHACQAPP